MASRLLPGEALNEGEQLVSANGHYKLTLQHDGNLVLYHDAKALWSSGTYGRATDSVVMQHDGNFVLYTPGHEPLWASDTHGHGAYLDLQDDGNVVIYQPNYPLWSTGTCGK